MASRPARKITVTAAQWNERHPVGTRVRIRFTKYDPWVETKTRSVAWNLCGHASVLVEGRSGGWCIDPEWMEVLDG